VVGRLLLGHSLGGCSGGETADRTEDIPAVWRVSAGNRGQSHHPERSIAVADVGVDLAGDVALEAPHDLSFAFALRGAALHVGAGAVVATHPA